MQGDNESLVMENKKQNLKYIPAYYFCSATLF